MLAVSECFKFSKTAILLGRKALRKHRTQREQMPKSLGEMVLSMRCPDEATTLVRAVGETDRILVQGPCFGVDETTTLVGAAW